MTIDLTDQLRPLPVTKPERASATPRIRLTYRKGKAWITVPTPIRVLMGLDPKEAHNAVVLLSRAQIAIERADHPHPRKLSTGGRITVPELIETLHLKDGEVFDIPVALEDGRIVGPLPETVFTRVGYMARKQRRAA